jgi:hypothetical protein
LWHCPLFKCSKWCYKKSLFCKQFTSMFLLMFQMTELLIISAKYYNFNLMLQFIVTIYTSQCITSDCAAFCRQKFIPWCWYPLTDIQYT